MKRPGIFVVTLQPAGGLLCRFRLWRGRKVGTTQGAILPNWKDIYRETGEIPAFAGMDRECHRKLPSASWRIRVKMWGKSPQCVVVTRRTGKPYGLQGQICSDPGKRFPEKHLPASCGSRESPGNKGIGTGRLLEPGGDAWPR